MLVTGICAWAFPSLRRADRFVAPDQAVLAEQSGKDVPETEVPAMVAGLNPKAEKGLP